MKIAKLYKGLKQITLKTIYFNLKFLPFKQALKFPIFISKNVRLNKLSGQLTITAPLKTGMIKIGYRNVGIFDHRYSRSILNIEGRLVFSGSAFIGHGSKISILKNAELLIGDSFTITAESTIIVHNRTITIGDNCLISWNVLITDTDFHKLYDLNGRHLNEPKDVKIGSKVWICSGGLILKGSNIPNNSVIAANSLVNKYLDEENTLIGGSPLHVLKRQIYWEM